MARYKLEIEYHGGPFCGWQQQADQPSVQQTLADAVKAFCGHSVTVFGAGRTDTGVHALGQVAHIDLQKEADPSKIRDGLNFHLKPHPVAVLEVCNVQESFDARLSALQRHYRYRIINRRAPLTLDAGFAWRVSVPLDAHAMHEAAQQLVGKHDFTTFRSAHCQARSPVKTLGAMQVRRFGEEIEIQCRALSFLHNQVRSLVGSVKLVGEGKWNPAMLRQALLAADRKRCGPVAPPQGLYLLQVDYPSDSTP